MTQYSPHPILADQARPADFIPLARFHWFVRMMFALAGVGLLSLLIIAATLDPDPRGRGTHEQLGLPACSFAEVLDAPCPSCGMTTAWAHLMHGHVTSAFQANGGGALLAILVVFIGPWLLAAGLMGRWIVNPPSDKVVLWAVVILASVTLVDWICRLVW